MAKPIKQLQPGQLVRSIAGRDRGRFYLVLRAYGDRVWLVDGRGRLPGNPKTKNPAHLQEAKRVSAEFAAGASAGALRPEFVRACLNELLTAGGKDYPEEEALVNV